MVLFLASGSKLPTGDHIDKIISAEIPDKDLFPELYEVVGELMVHGPCSPENPKNVCMQEGRCTKFFPKPYSPITKIDDARFPIYRRRDDQQVINKKGIDCDNRYVVSYNKDLSIRYRAHINVEWCNQTHSIKYLFKYNTKGPDYIRATLENGSPGVVPDNEVEKHFNCMYEYYYYLFYFLIIYLYLFMNLHKFIY